MTSFQVLPSMSRDYFKCDPVDQREGELLFVVNITNKRHLNHNRHNQHDDDHLSRGDLPASDSPAPGLH